MANRVLLKGAVIKEGVASSAITPGDLVEFGGANDLQRHSTGGGNARKAFALTNDMVGGGIDDDYAAGQTVRYAVPHTGVEVNAILSDDNTIAKGEALESDGAGKLQKWGTVSDAGNHGNLVGYAMEAVSTNVGENKRIRVEVA